MSWDACPLPGPKSAGEDEVIRRLVRAKRVAVVGASDDPSRASYQIASYLKSVGKEVVPVNPNHPSVLGLTCYPALADIPGDIDLVDVFRRPEFCPGVVEEAIATRAKAVWLQSGIYSEEAKRLAEEAGIDFVQGPCLMVEHMRAGG